MPSGRHIPIALSLAVALMCRVAAPSACRGDEWAEDAAYGSFWTQAEWYGSRIDQTGGEDVFFHGCYVDALLSHERAPHR